MLSEKGGVRDPSQLALFSTKCQVTRKPKRLIKTEHENVYLLFISIGIGIGDSVHLASRAIL